MKKIAGALFFAVILIFSLNSCKRMDINKANIKSYSTKITKSKVDTIITQPTMSHTPVPVTTTEETAVQAVPVLTYHSISYEKGNSIRLPVEKFKEQMKWLKDNGYQTINLDELYDHFKKNSSLPAKPVVITFDDGYSDNYIAAYPILKEFGFNATIYIITNTVDKSPSYLSSVQIKEMDKGGITFGSHTEKHEELDKQTYEDQLITIRQSREYLDKLLGKKTRHFAYPVGLYNRDTIKILRQEGFISAVTMNRGWVNGKNDFLTLNRVFIGSDFSMDIFKERLTNPDYNVISSNSILNGNHPSPAASRTEAPDERAARLEILYTKGYNLFIKEGNYKKAIEVENSLIKEDPGNYKAYSVLGIAQCYAGNYQEGIRNIDKALELKPDYGYGRFNKALALELYGKYNESLKWYDKALEVEDYVWSYYGKASIFGRRGDVANTVLNLKKAIEFGDFVKKEAISEHDFDPVRDSLEFRALLN